MQFKKIKVQQLSVDQKAALWQACNSLQQRVMGVESRPDSELLLELVSNEIDRNPEFIAKLAEIIVART